MTLHTQQLIVMGKRGTTLTLTIVRRVLFLNLHLLEKQKAREKKRLLEIE